MHTVLMFTTCFYLFMYCTVSFYPYGLLSEIHYYYYYYYYYYYWIRVDHEGDDRFHEIMANIIFFCGIEETMNVLPLYYIMKTCSI